MAMEMFEKASKLKLRFETSAGNLSTEDLWDLSLESLNSLAKSLNKQIKEIDEEDFLKVAKTGERIIKLKFKIVIHVLETIKLALDKHVKAIERKAQKQRILEIIAKKQDESLEGKSEDELKGILDSFDAPEEDVEDVD